jgi:hypothetical protein
MSRWLDSKGRLFRGWITSQSEREDLLVGIASIFQSVCVCTSIRYTVLVLTLLLRALQRTTRSNPWWEVCMSSETNEWSLLYVRFFLLAEREMMTCDVRTDC